MTKFYLQVLFLTVALLLTTVPVALGQKTNDLASLVNALDQLDRKSLEKLVDAVKGTPSNKGTKKGKGKGKKKRNQKGNAVVSEPEEQTEEAPRLTISSRMADLSGCGAYLTCSSCATASPSGTCYWNPQSGCELANGRQSVCTGNTMMPGETRMQCQEYSDCRQCTKNSGCIWYKSQCTYSRGDGCLRDPQNCVNFESQCPAPVPTSNIQLTPVSNSQYSAFSQPTTTSYSQPTTSYSQPTTSYNQPTTSYYEPTNTQPSYQQPTTSYQQPTTSYQQSTTSYQQPTTSYQQPTTSYQQPTTSYTQPTTSYTQSTTSYSQPISTIYTAQQTSIPTISYSGGVVQQQQVDEVDVLASQITQLTEQLELMQHQQSIEKQVGGSSLNSGVQGIQYVDSQGYPATTQYTSYDAQGYPATTQYTSYDAQSYPINSNTQYQSGPTQAEIQRQQQLESQIAQLEQQMMMQQQMAQQQMAQQQMIIMQQQQAMQNPQQIAFEQQKQQLQMQQQQEFTARQQELDMALMEEYKIRQIQLVSEFLQQDQKDYLNSLSPDDAAIYIRNILPTMNPYYQQQLRQREQQITMELNAKRETELAILSQQHQAALANIYPTRPQQTGGVYPTKPVNNGPMGPSGGIYPTRPIINTGSVSPMGGSVSPMGGSGIYPTRPIVTTGPQVTANVYPTRPVINTGFSGVMPNVYPTRPVGPSVSVTQQPSMSNIYPTRPAVVVSNTIPTMTGGIYPTRPVSANVIAPAWNARNPSTLSTTVTAGSIYQKQNDGTEVLIVNDNNGQGSTVYSKGSITGTIYVTKTPSAVATPSYNTNSYTSAPQSVHSSQGSITGKIYTTKTDAYGRTTTTVSGANNNQPTVFVNSAPSTVFSNTANNPLPAAGTVVNNWDGSQTVYEQGSLTGKVYATKLPAPQVATTPTTTATVYSQRPAAVANTVNSFPQAATVNSGNMGSLDSLLALGLGGGNFISTGAVVGNNMLRSEIVTSPVTGKVYATKLDKDGNIESVTAIGDSTVDNDLYYKEGASPPAPAVVYVASPSPAPNSLLLSSWGING